MMMPAFYANHLTETETTHYLRERERERVFFKLKKKKRKKEPLPPPILDDDCTKEHE